MRRETHPPRADWQEQVEQFGLIYHTLDGIPYWDESVSFELTSEDVGRLESATEEVHRLCLETVASMIQEPHRPELGLSAGTHDLIRASWEHGHPHLYGRFDFAYDGTGEPKLLEYNADTPTALLEAAVIQWQWLQAVSPGADQFNLIWEALVERFRSAFAGETIHFAHQDWWEDMMTVSLLRDAAEEAGVSTEAILMEDIGWSEAQSAFVDLEERPIHRCFKLYPWEAMLADEFGAAAVRPDQLGIWIEPIWKLPLATKSILAELWRRYPGHPNLLPCTLEEPRGRDPFVSKPFFSREGAGIQVVSDGEVVAETPRELVHQQFVYQEMAQLFQQEGQFAVIGSWVVGDEACGIGIRESEGPITRDTSRFVPHRIIP